MSTEPKQMFTNPDLEWDKKPAQDIGDAKVEQPTGWAYVTDPLRKPAFSLHIDKNGTLRGFHIGGGWRAVKVGLQQRVRLIGGQRYVLHAWFESEVHANVNPPYVDGSVNAYWFVSGKQGGLSKLSPAIKHKPTEHMTVIEATASGQFDIAFWLESQWPYEAVKMNVRRLECMEVGSTYGDVILKVAPAVPDTTPDPEPPKPEPAGVEAIALVSTPPPVNVRSNAGLEYALIGELRNGERIKKLGTKLDSAGAEWLYFKRYGYDTTPALTGYTSLKNGVVRVQPLEISAPVPLPPVEGQAPVIMPKEAYDQLMSEMETMKSTITVQRDTIRIQGESLAKLREERKTKITLALQIDELVNELVKEEKVSA